MMMVMPVVVMCMIMAVIVRMVIVLMPMVMSTIMSAAAIRAMVMPVNLAARRCVHHRLQAGIGRGVQQMAIFAAERG